MWTLSSSAAQSPVTRGLGGSPLTPNSLSTEKETVPIGQKTSFNKQQGQRSFYMGLHSRPPASAYLQDLSIALKRAASQKPTQLSSDRKGIGDCLT